MGRLDLIRMEEISSRMDLYPLQDSFRFRARHLGLTISAELIDEKGELKKEAISFFLARLERGLFSLGPNREGDVLIFDHLRSCLRHLEGNRAIETWIRKFSPPLCHKRAEEVIRETLWPETVHALQPYHVRRAALAAWMTLLRQTTGSCFATAPAILIQKGQPVQFFKDLYDLLMIGQLKRVTSGKECAVPLSPSPGKGDLERLFFPGVDLVGVPGLVAALEAAEVSSPNQLLARSRRERTPKALLRALLLEQEGLSEEELQAEADLERLRKPPPIFEGVYYQKPSERALKISDWNRRLKKAELTFFAMTESSLLRTWEYTLASFCDVLLDFARWNLFVGLGLHPDQKGGIGEFLFSWINSRLQKSNAEASAFHREYEEALTNARMAEALLHRSLSDAQRYRYQTELSSAMHAADMALEMRDRAAKLGETLVHLFPSLLEQYNDKLRDYFQELFDPSVSSGTEQEYEDSPAGFRLVYKHGRADASLWTPVHNGEEYIEALRDFFTSIERDLAGEREILTEITTALVNFLRRSDFLKKAKERSREKGRKSPWDYISGGTMQTLLQVYYNREKPLTELAYKPSSPEEGLHLLLEVKRVQKRDLLMHSPTHAFLFRPELLSDEAEERVEEARRVVKQWQIDGEMQEHLAHLFSLRLSVEERPLFLHLWRQKLTAVTLLQFRQNLLDALGKSPRGAVGVDSLLYEQCPPLRWKEAKAAMRDMLKEVSGRCALSWVKILEQLERWEPSSIQGALQMQEIAKELLLRSGVPPLSSLDLDLEISKAARQFGVAYPHPILFADTNWSGWFFGWVVNPATEQLELWRLNRTGSKGYPMNDWKIWFSPENQIPWIVLPKIEEYSGSVAYPT